MTTRVAFQQVDVFQRDRLLARDGYVASLGRGVGRDGRVHVRLDRDGSIWLGGHAVTCVEGTLTV